MNDIAIIIPAYNVEKYIGRCIESLVKQVTSVRFTLEIVDDGSKDKTSDIVEEYVAQYPETIHLLKKTNSGQSSARNYGLEHSSSEYVMFVDSDDYVEPIFVESLYKLLISTDSDIAMCAMNRVLGDDGEGKRFDSGFKKDFVTEDIDEVLKYSSFAPCNKIYKRILFKDLLFPVGMTYEDFALIPQVINRARKIAYTDKVLYHYYCNENSTIVSASKKKKTDRNIIKAQHILENSELKDKKNILEIFYLRRVLSSMAWTILEYHEGYEELKYLVDEANCKYPSIKKNQWIKTQPMYKQVFLNMILDGNFGGGRVLVSCYSLLRLGYKYFRK